MPKFFHGGHYDDEPDTVPSRLGELTPGDILLLHADFERKQRESAQTEASK